MYKEDVNRYINNIIHTPKLNTYVILFEESCSLEPLCIKIAEVDENYIRNDINFIKGFILEKYGNVKYKLIPLNLLETFEFR